MHIQCYCIILAFVYFKEYYLAITVQYIYDWELFHFPIAFSHVIGAHTAQAIGHKVADLIVPFLGS